MKAALVFNIFWPKNSISHVFTAQPENLFDSQAKSVLQEWQHFFLKEIRLWAAATADD